MSSKPNLFALLCYFVVFCLCLSQCDSSPVDEDIALHVPRGFVSNLDIETNSQLVHFGPFVGYYFCPKDPQDLTYLEFVCFNERSFYTKDLPANIRLFKGEAKLVSLPPDAIPEMPEKERMHPVFSADIPHQWLETRPNPQEEFVHFHSCYDANGPVHKGYWLRHIALESFTYDMGGRVGPNSPLYHRVKSGVDKDFPMVVEFDRGPSD